MSVYDLLSRRMRAWIEKQLKSSFRTENRCFWWTRLPWKPDHTAVGHYTVRGDEWFLQGHFPGNPVVPGVVLCEMMGQTCCVLLADKIGGSTPYFTGINQVKFRNPVHPGEHNRNALLYQANASKFLLYGVRRLCRRQALRKRRAQLCACEVTKRKGRRKALCFRRS